MNFRKSAREFAIRLFRSQRGQRFLDRVASHVDLWRGYGAGVCLASSGETVLFDLVRKGTRRVNNAVIFDVGANVGDFTTAAFEALGGDITIHAFEPARDTFQKLSARFTANNRVILNNVALGREAGERALFGVVRDTGMASLFQRNLGDGEPPEFQEMVELVRLSDYCSARRIERINLLKLDVEGFELEVLLGAEPFFSEGRIDICSFEFGGCNLDSRTYLRDFFEFFQGRNMEIFRITPAAEIVSLPRYSESLEKFSTTNYVAVRRAERIGSRPAT